MGSGTTIAVGRRVEQLAHDYLAERGLSLLARNFRSRGGEIDIIMLDGDCLAFIEVRFRTSSSFAEASHTVDSRKQRKLIRTAALYVARNRRHASRTMRFDVVAVEGEKEPAFRWIKDAFRPHSSTL